jgi:hypothetical protein
MLIKRRLILSPILKGCWVHFKYTALILMICCLLVFCLTSSGKYFMHIQDQNNISVCVLNLMEAKIVWLMINHYFVNSNFLLQHTFHQCIRPTSVVIELASNVLHHGFEPLSGKLSIWRLENYHSFTPMYCYPINILHIPNLALKLYVFTSLSLVLFPNRSEYTCKKVFQL